MSARLLPRGFDASVKRAVRSFWAARAAGVGLQAGSRGDVIAGKHMDGFLAVVQEVAAFSGVPSEAVHVRGRRDLTIPGYFRPTKNWDVVIVHRQRLLAVLEFKSQVGSFGNNFNNRAEEVIGNACDLLAASRQGAYHPANHIPGGSGVVSDPRPPFLGYLMLLEDCEASTQPVGEASAHFRVFPEFVGTSYAERYRILCERLMEQRLYTSAALMLSPTAAGHRAGQHRPLTNATSSKSLFAALAGHLMVTGQPAPS